VWIWSERTRTNDNRSAAQGERTKRTNGHTPYRGVSASESRLTSGLQFSIPSGRNGISSARICGQGNPNVVVASIGVGSVRSFGSDNEAAERSITREAKPALLMFVRTS
jgi:hypothetical protein